MTETLFLGIMGLFFTPVFLALGYLVKSNRAIDKHLVQINGTLEKHEKVYKACPFCPDKERG